VAPIRSRTDGLTCLLNIHEWPSFVLYCLILTIP
jgi:hypothetical protein